MNLENEPMPGLRRHRRGARVNGARAGAVALACLSMVLAGLPTAAMSESLLEAQYQHGNGVGVFVDGHLACWLTVQPGRRRHNVTFSLSDDGVTCSIAPQVRAAPRRNVGAGSNGRAHVRPVSYQRSKCFIFDGRQFCE